MSLFFCFTKCERKETKGNKQTHDEVRIKKEKTLSSIQRFNQEAVIIELKLLV